MAGLFSGYILLIYFLWFYEVPAISVPNQTSFFDKFPHILLRKKAETSALLLHVIWSPPRQTRSRKGDNQILWDTRSYLYLKPYGYDAYKYAKYGYLVFRFSCNWLSILLYHTFQKTETFLQKYELQLFAQSAAPRVIFDLFPISEISQKQGICGQRKAWDNRENLMNEHHKSPENQLPTPVFLASNRPSNRSVNLRPESRMIGGFSANKGNDSIPIQGIPFRMGAGSLPSTGMSPVWVTSNRWKLRSICPSMTKLFRRQSANAISQLWLIPRKKPSPGFRQKRPTSRRRPKPRPCPQRRQLGPTWARKCPWRRLKRSGQSGL